MTIQVDPTFDERLRAAAMAWLDQRCTPDDPVIGRQELNDFHFEGRRISLVDRGQGIRTPKDLSAALTIMTTYTSDSKRAPYEDALGADGFLRYKYRGTDPQFHTNKSLREAHRRQLPLIWFFGVRTSLYLPFYPVWILADEPEQLQIVLSLDRSQAESFSEENIGSPLERNYRERTSRQRLHQPVFRQRVIHAYDGSCAMCHLRHKSLLDAAHIIPDREERGIPAISNGLALCKIHHAAYDENIVGIRPNLVIEVRSDILEEVDGPMLRHGLQEMNGLSLRIPRRRIDRPDSLAIEHRYEQFRAAG